MKQSKKHTELRMYSIAIIVPFWLKWVKRFIRFDVEKHKVPSEFSGKNIKVLIIDEANHIDDASDWDDPNMGYRTIK